LWDVALALGFAVAGISAAATYDGSGPATALVFVLAALTTFPLAARCVYPIPVLAVLVAVAVVVGLAYQGWWPFAVIVALYSVAAHCRRRTAIVAGAAALLAMAAPIIYLVDWSPLGWNDITLVVGRFAPLVAAWLLGDNVGTRRAYLRAVEDRAAQLEREQEANARRAAAEEQARIAREVHDVVAHNLSVIIVQATAADEVFASDPDDAHRAVRTIGRTARRALDELRHVLGSSGERGLAPQPTLGGLDGLLERVRAAGLPVELEIVGRQPELTPALELSAYRIVQEALTNTLRHADAERAVVRLSFESDALTVEVSDDGSAPSAGNGGNGRGLIGMRERVATFGGSLDAGPDSQGGFRVTARLPFALTPR
jgi:signal transduction histidine kinase